MEPVNLVKIKTEPMELENYYGNVTGVDNIDNGSSFVNKFDKTGKVYCKVFFLIQ